MDKMLVHGGYSLSGKVRISGSKNSALPILAATLLTREKCIIERIPDLSDVHYMLTILSLLNCSVERSSGTVQIRAENIQHTASYDIVRKMRASICILGPLLARKKKATIALPGGCVIGDRPIDLHLKGFKALGAHVSIEHGNVLVHAENLKGATIQLTGKHGSTVLGTGNIMMAAVLADGCTIIDGAALEPEVADLAHFLIAMGAKISGVGTSRLEIEGVKELHGAHHIVIPDRIESGTMLVAGAMIGKEITIERTEPLHITAITNELKKAGYTMNFTESSITIFANKQSNRILPLNIITTPYPGFPTDMQAQFCALLSLIHGMSLVRETIFTQRFMHIAELKRMGANMELEDQCVRIHGVNGLSPAPVMASDLRASAALILAAIATYGITEINRVYHIDRGYEVIDQKLNDLGAHIERVKGQV